jgi:hypothetical protein
LEKSVGVASDLLGEHVDVLDAAVRGAATRVVREDLGTLPLNRASQPGEFDGVGLGAVLHEYDQPAAGMADIDRVVDLVSDHEIWDVLGDQAGDELAIAATVVHLRDRILFFNAINIAPGLGVTANEFAALSWNFSLDTVEEIASGDRPFGVQTSDYIETLRWNYWQVGFSVTCPEVASCDFGPAPLPPTRTLVLLSRL